MTLLSLKKVTYHAPFMAPEKSRAILQDVSFDLKRAECVALIGPNGAGKTTLLRCILGLNKFLGDIILEDRDISAMCPTQRAQRIAYVPQALEHIPDLSVRELIEMGRYCHNDYAVCDSSHPSVYRAIEQLDLLTLCNRSLISLSGGERQRCLIAAALAQDPTLLLLDEPTAFLDPGVREDILRWVTKLSTERDMSVVFVTHDINAAASYSERVIALRAGQLVFDGTATFLLNQQSLSQIYSRDFRLIPDPIRNIPVVVAA